MKSFIFLSLGKIWVSLVMLFVNPVKNLPKGEPLTKEDIHRTIGKMLEYYRNTPMPPIMTLNFGYVEEKIVNSVDIYYNTMYTGKYPVYSEDFLKAVGRYYLFFNINASTQKEAVEVYLSTMLAEKFETEMENTAVHF